MKVVSIILAKTVYFCLIFGQFLLQQLTSKFQQNLNTFWNHKRYIYRKILNPVDSFKHILGGIFTGTYITRAFLLVIVYQDFKIYYHINKISIKWEKDHSLSKTTFIVLQNNIKIHLSIFYIFWRYTLTYRPILKETGVKHEIWPLPYL